MFRKHSPSSEHQKISSQSVSKHDSIFDMRHTRRDRKLGGVTGKGEAHGSGDVVCSALIEGMEKIAEK